MLKPINDFPKPGEAYNIDMMREKYNKNTKYGNIKAIKRLPIDGHKNGYERLLIETKAPGVRKTAW